MQLASLSQTQINQILACKALEEILFFDNERGNCVDVSAIGVTGNYTREGTENLAHVTCSNGSLRQYHHGNGSVLRPRWSHSKCVEKGAGKLSKSRRHDTRK